MPQIELNGFDDFQKELHKLSQRDIARTMCQKAGAYLQRTLVKNTPVSEYNPLDTFKKPGSLRKKWVDQDNNERVLNPRKIGTGYEITLINDDKNCNDDPYGSYVDQGHDQEVGRYVKQIQRSLVREHVPGVEFMEQAEMEVEQTLRIYLENELESILRS